MKMQDVDRTRAAAAGPFLRETLRALEIAEGDVEVAIRRNDRVEGLDLLVATPVGLLVVRHAEVERSPESRMTAEVVAWDRVQIDVTVTTDRYPEQGFFPTLEMTIRVPIESDPIALRADPRSEADEVWRSGVAEFGPCCLQWKAKV